MAGRTPSQTIGPFFHEALRWEDGARVTLAQPGERIVLTGRIVDGAGEPVSDALMETWQRALAPATGNAKPHGFARLETSADGSYRIETTLPAGDAPCLEVTLFARGLLKALRTRVYFAPQERVRADPALAALADSPRLATLVARRDAGGWRWDVRLQGEGETVFFAA